MATNNRDKERARKAFQIIGRADGRFTRSYRLNSGWNDQEWQKQAGVALRTTERVLDAAKGVITEEDLLDERNEMGGSLDPATVLVMRAKLGTKVVTKKAYGERIRQEWCGSDLPRALDGAICDESDERFVQEVESFQFDKYGNVLMGQLQKRGIRRLLPDKRNGKIGR